MDVFNSIQLLKRRKWIVLLGTLFGLVFVLAGAKTAVQMYASSAKLLINPPRPSEFNGLIMGGSDITSNTAVLAEMMLSQDFLDRVVKSAKLQETWLKLRDQLGASEDLGGPRNVLKISVTSTDPAEAHSICEAVAAEFTHYIPEYLGRERGNNRKFLQGLVDEAQEKLDKAEADIVAWQEKHRALDVNAKASSYSDQMAKLQAERLEYAQKVAELEARIRDLDSGGSVPWTILDEKNSVLPQLQQALSQEQLKLTKLEQIYQPGNVELEQERVVVTKMRANFDAEVKSQISSLGVERQAQLREATAKLAAVDASIKSMRGTWSLAQDKLEYARLEREIDIWTKNYEQLLGQLYSARIAEQLSRREGALTVLEAASPGMPVGAGIKSWKRTLPVAFPFCVGFGIILAFVFEYVTTSMRMRPRIEDAMELPIIGVIPKMPQPVVEEWDTLRTRALVTTPLGAAITAPASAPNGKGKVDENHGS
jgi:uncharacterized protein involved in exopolysaccharide biosynthesis